MERHVTLHNATLCTLDGSTVAELGDVTATVTEPDPGPILDISCRNEFSARIVDVVGDLRAFYRAICPYRQTQKAEARRKAWAELRSPDGRAVLVDGEYRSRRRRRQWAMESASLETVPKFRAQFIPREEAKPSGNP